MRPVLVITLPQLFFKFSFIIVNVEAERTEIIRIFRWGVDLDPSQPYPAEPQQFPPLARTGTGQKVS